MREAGRRLTDAGVASGPHDARALAEYVLGTSLVAADGASPAELERYRALVERRAGREPLQLITGRMFFRGLELRARPGVFIVRPETEVVAGVAIRAAREVADQGRQPLVVDLCAGSGAIACAVAAEVPSARVVAVEMDDAAARLARDNADVLVPGQVEVRRGDATSPAMLAELDGRVDVVVSNPPYVPDGDLEDAETEGWDPDLALYGGGGDGLEVPVGVVRRAAGLLAAGGVLVVEHDYRQGLALRQAACAAGLSQATTGQDLTGRDRYVCARRTGHTPV